MRLEGRPLFGDGGKITQAEVSTPNTGMADSLRESLLSMGVPKSKIDAMVAEAGSGTPKAKPTRKTKARKKASSAQR